MSRARRGPLILLATALLLHAALAPPSRAPRRLVGRAATAAGPDRPRAGARRFPAVLPRGRFRPAEHGRRGRPRDAAHRLRLWAARRLARSVDRLDPEARYAPTLAAYYFGQTPDRDDLRRIVAYLGRIGARDPARNWRWLAHAAYLARHRLHDLPLALAVARHLAGLPEGEVPLWVRQMPAFVLAEVGEREAARDLMATILATDANLSPDEADLIERFIDNQEIERR